MSDNQNNEVMDEEIPENQEEQGHQEPDGDEGESKNKIAAEVQARLSRQAAKHAKEMAQVKAEKEELAQRLASMSQPQQQAPAMGQSIPQGAQQFTPDQVAAYQQQAVAQHQKAQTHLGFISKLKEAAEKDPEFKKLAGDEVNPQSGNYLPNTADFLENFHHLPNAAAVIKHLKKNNKDYAVLTAINKKSDLVDFLNKVSDKLENNQTAPRPPEYEPEPDLSNNGSSGQDFDLDDYVKKNGLY